MREKWVNDVQKKIHCQADSRGIAIISSPSLTPTRPPQSRISIKKYKQPAGLDHQRALVSHTMIIHSSQICVA